MSSKAQHCEAGLILLRNLPRRRKAPVSSNTASTSPVTRQRPLFRQEVIEFQQHNRKWGRVVPLQPLSTRVMVWCVCTAAACVVGFLFFAQYARKETASGYLAPVAGTARVFAQKEGIISSVYVEQGDSVEKGQPLLAVATSQFTGGGEDVNTTILNTLAQQKQQLSLAIADEVSRTASERLRLTTQLQEHEGILRQLEAQMAVQRARIAIQEKTVEAGAELRAKGLVSDVDQRHREEALLEQKQALIQLYQQATTRQGQLSEVRFNLEQLPLVQGKQGAIAAQRAFRRGPAHRRGERSQRLYRPSPDQRPDLVVAGLARAAGGSAAAAAADRARMTACLQAELFIPVRAIGFVEVGQDVRVLFDAFPYQRFGTFHGRITKVSHTVLLASDVEAPVRAQGTCLYRDRGAGPGRCRGPRQENTAAARHVPQGGHRA